MNHTQFVVYKIKKLQSIFFFQLAYGSLISGMSNQPLLSSLYYMVPNESHQHTGIVLLLLHFRWTWVGLFVVGDENGERFLQAMVPMLSQNGICFAFIERTLKRTYDIRELFLTWLKKSPAFLTNKANVFVVYSVFPSMRQLSWLLHLTALDSPIGKVWIVTAHWDFRSTTQERHHSIQSFHGAISISVHSRNPLEFSNFLKHVNPYWAKGDGFIHDFWEQAFRCSLKNSSMMKGEKKDISCTGKEKLESLPGPLFEMSMTGYSYSIYNAVHAIAHALHAMYETRIKHQTWVTGRKMELGTPQPWQVIGLQKHISFVFTSKLSKHCLSKISCNYIFKTCFTFPQSSLSQM